MSYDGRYDYPPLEIGGGRIENLTISALKNDSSNIITDNAASYAIHADYDSGDDLSIKNCNIKSDFYPAIGAGLFQNKTITIDNCYLEGNQENTGEHISSGGLGSLFVHNRPQSGVTGQRGKRRPEPGMNHDRIAVFGAGFGPPDHRESGRPACGWPARRSPGRRRKVRSASGPAAPRGCPD